MTAILSSELRNPLGPELLVRLRSDDFLQDLNHWQQFVHSRMPDHVQIDVEICVNELVPHAHNT